MRIERVRKSEFKILKIGDCPRFLNLTYGLEQDGIKQLQLAEKKNANLYKDERQRLIKKLIDKLPLREETRKAFLSAREMSFEYWSELHWNKAFMRAILKHEKQGDTVKVKEYSDLGQRLLNNIPESEREYKNPNYSKKLEFFKREEESQSQAMKRF